MLGYNIIVRYPRNHTGLKLNNKWETNTRKIQRQVKHEMCNPMYTEFYVVITTGTHCIFFLI